MASAGRYVRPLIIGGLVFLLLLILRAPAGLIHLFLPADSPAALLNLNGTVWNGAGDLLAGSTPIGRLAWSLRPVSLLRATIRYDAALTGQGVDLRGNLAAGFGATRAEVAGSVKAAFVNQWLEPYDIELSGNFELIETTADITNGQLTALSGTLNWDGGPLRYSLSGNLHNSVLPPMTADLGPGPEAVAYATGESTPLLLGALKADGYARIGVTKYLTRILGQSWPGGDPDHAVVLEVEEQVF